MISVPFHGSIGLIRQTTDNYSSWLGRWDPRERCFDFISAMRLQNESYRECLSREIAWTLNLRRDRDYLISSVARLHYVADDTEAEFFVVDPYGKSALDCINADSANRWLRRHELHSRRTDDGRSISAEICDLLFAADVLPHDLTT